MLYHEVSQVSIFGLHGLLQVQEAVDAEAVSVQIEGPYEAKVVDGTWLLVYRQGHEPPIVSPIVRQYHTDITIGQSSIGSIDATVRIRFLTDSGPLMTTRAPARFQAIARITAPPGTRFELIGCYGLYKDLRGWRYMEGDVRFDIC